MSDIDDWMQIHRLEGAYGPCWDSGDAAGWAELFTKDGEFILVADDPAENETISGRAALRYFCIGISRDWRALHMLHLPSLTIDGDHAAALVPFQCRLLHRVGTTNSDTHVFGVYRVEYARTDAGWRIRRREEQLAVSASATWNGGIYEAAGLLHG